MNVASAMSFVWDTKPDFPSDAFLDAFKVSLMILPFLLLDVEVLGGALLLGV